MKENVCKFTSVISSDLNCSSLVFETTSVQASKTRVKEHIIGIVTEGKGRLIDEKNEKDLSEGSIFLIKKNTVFSINSEKLLYLYTSFHGRRADELVERAGVDSESFVYTPQNSESLIKFVFECLERANNQNVDLVAQSVLLLLFSCICNAEKKSPPLMSQILSLTCDNFSSVNFSLSSLAKVLGYDPKYLSSYFKKNKGICYTYYLRDLRIRHSIFLIEQGITGVKSIAWLSGFSDPLYFSKIFKSVTGLSPKAYIDKLHFQ